jgi:catechol 2,3-dioxygenase-like lactoylglutathione lyase family enzyme
MQPQISVITLGVDDLARSKRFYMEGFGWTPIFENDNIVFYQLAATVLGTWLADHLVADMGLGELSRPGLNNMGHNLANREDVDPAMARLAAAGGRILKPAIDQFYGGYAGYLADPDGHVWEIAWNPGFTLHADGRVSFGVA